MWFYTNTHRHTRPARSWIASAQWSTLYSSIPEITLMYYSQSHKCMWSNTHHTTSFRELPQKNNPCFPFNCLFHNKHKFMKTDREQTGLNRTSLRCVWWSCNQLADLSCRMWSIEDMSDTETTYYRYITQRRK